MTTLPRSLAIVTLGFLCFWGTEHGWNVMLVAALWVLFAALALASALDR